MSMHIPPIDMKSDLTATKFPQMSPVAKPISPSTQSDILGILQREQDRALELLSSSPLLASLFVSYANQAATLEFSNPTESEELQALENTISILQEENDKLKPENLRITERLTAAAASLEAFRSQVASLKEVNVTQQHDIKSLRAELLESKDKYNRLVENSKAEIDALRSMVSDLQVRQADLKETIVIQQLRLSKVDPETAPQPPIEPDQSVLSAATEGKTNRQCDEERMEREAQEKKEREARERKEREERENQKRERAKREVEKKEREERERHLQERAERERREHAERETREQAERETRERAEREAREQAEREARERDERRVELLRAKREAREWVEREARKKAEREARERVEQEARERVEREAREQAERKAREQAELEVRERDERRAESLARREARERAKQVAREQAEREARERAERETREQAERKAREQAEREARERAEKKAREVAERGARLRARREDKERAEREVREAKERGEQEKLAVATLPPVTGTEGPQSVLTGNPCDQKRENRRGNLVEDSLGSNQGNRRPDSAQSQVTTKPAHSPTQKSHGWGSWGSLLDSIAASVVVDVPPPPEPLPAKPKGSKKNSRPPSPVEGKQPQQKMGTKEPADAEEVVTPVDEDEFDWVSAGEKNKGSLSAVARAPSVPNAPDPDDADDGVGGCESKKVKAME